MRPQKSPDLRFTRGVLCLRLHQVATVYIEMLVV
jgi:hypothetical protein